MVRGKGDEWKSGSLSRKEVGVWVKCDCRKNVEKEVRKENIGKKIWKNKKGGRSGRRKLQVTTSSTTTLW